MANDDPLNRAPVSGDRYKLSSLLTSRSLVSLAGITLLLTAVVVTFAGFGGWLSPDKLTPSAFIDRLQELGGSHPGFRRNHAKGLCFTASFDSNGKGSKLSKAVLFQEGSTPVIGRLALAGGMPMAADSAGDVRSMALSFKLSNGEEWRTGMNDIPVFIVSTPEAFYDELKASRPDPATGKPDPKALKDFMTSHPEMGRALGLIKAKPFSTGFDNATYNSLDAFRVVDADGHSLPVRWSMESLQPYMPESDMAAPDSDKNYLFNEVMAAGSAEPLQWRLVITVGKPDDPTNDATNAWPEDREKIDVGTMTIQHFESENTGACRDINFDPLVLPSGIEPSDDPLLSARSAAYAQSVRRRDGEPKSPSAIDVPSQAEETNQ